MKSWHQSEKLALKWSIGIEVKSGQFEVCIEVRNQQESEKSGLNEKLAESGLYQSEMSLWSESGFWSEKSTLNWEVGIELR